MFKRKTPAQPLPRPLRIIRYVRFGLIFCFVLLLVLNLGFIIPNMDKNRRLVGLAIDNGDNSYVSDAANSIIRKFDSTGKQVAIFGGRGSGNGQFGSSSDPQRLAVGPGDTIYALDEFNNRVQQFDSDGNFLASFGSGASGPGQLDYPGNMVVDKLGQVYIAQGGNLQKYDPSGKYLGILGEGQPGVDKLSTRYALAVDSAGNIFAGGDTYNKFLVFSPQGQLLKTIEVPGMDGGRYAEFRYFAVDRQDNLYLTIDNNKELVKADATGNVVSRWPLGGEKYGTGNYPGIAFDSQNNVYILYRNSNAVEVFDSNGQQLREFSAGWPDWITGNLFIFQLVMSLIPITLIIFEQTYRKRHNLEVPKQKGELFARNATGKASQIICLTAAIFGILIGFPAAAISTVLNPKSISSLTASPVPSGPNLQEIVLLYGPLVLYILVLNMVFLVKKKPVIAGILQIIAGTLIFLATDVLVLRVLPLAIIIGGALALYDSSKKSLPPVNNNYRQ